MPPVIDLDKCTGCGICQDSCPLDVLYLDEATAQFWVKYPEECWHCGSCRQECPAGAVTIRFPLRVLLAAGVVPY
jgi:NAD-dependent dihydropyrimidine dehydrogenase PreA subunit